MAAKEKMTDTPFNIQIHFHRFLYSSAEILSFFLLSNPPNNIEEAYPKEPTHIKIIASNNMEDML